jgi:hypothetical protein
LGSVALAAPSGLPKTESSGEAYATDLHSAEIPAAWLQPGLQLRVKADNYAASALKAVKVGADNSFNVRTLPFYLFGATEANTYPLTLTANPPADAIREMKAKWPVSSLTAANHPANAVFWPSIVVKPRVDKNDVKQPAYLVTDANQQKEGYAVMSAALGILSKMMAANGESDTATQYYGALMMLGSNGKYYSPGGGLGGGDNGVGDHLYAGVYIHEQGHAFGLPHAADGYANGTYPYVGGSLAGSAWGFDSDKKELLAPFLPSTASTYKNCVASASRQIDVKGRCIKQDPMQGGSGDQSTGYKYATFSDYNTAVMQRYFEGKTTQSAAGVREYSGGKLVRDTSFAGGYRRWDAIDSKWVNHTPKTTDKGLYGLNGGLPITHDVPVHAIVVSFSYAGSVGASQIYSPVSYVGNLLQQIDPTNATQLASIVPTTNSSVNQWFCQSYGCDYTIRVTYADNTQSNTLLQGGFRKWFDAAGTTLSPTATDPLDGDSLRTWVINVPGNKAVSKIELLDTPQAWKGIGSNPTVLLSRTFL